MRQLWRRFLDWWNEPMIVIHIHETRSPDWEGDAARYRKMMGYDDGGCEDDGGFEEQR